MISALQRSLSAIKAFGEETNVSAHNIANMNTDNFQGIRTTLAEDKQGGVKCELRNCSNVSTVNS